MSCEVKQLPIDIAHLPTKAPPGSAEKLGVLARRFGLGISLWHQNDSPMLPHESPSDSLRLLVKEKNGANRPADRIITKKNVEKPTQWSGQDAVVAFLTLKVIPQYVSAICAATKLPEDTVRAILRKAWPNPFIKHLADAGRVLWSVRRDEDECDD